MIKGETGTFEKTILGSEDIGCRVFSSRASEASFDGINKDPPRGTTQPRTTKSYQGEGASGDRFAVESAAPRFNDTTTFHKDAAANRSHDGTFNYLLLVDNFCFVDRPVVLG